MLPPVSVVEIDVLMARRQDLGQVTRSGQVRSTYPVGHSPWRPPQTGPGRWRRFHEAGSPPTLYWDADCWRMCHCCSWCLEERTERWTDKNTDECSALEFPGSIIGLEWNNILGRALEKLGSWRHSRGCIIICSTKGVWFRKPILYIYEDKLYGCKLIKYKSTGNKFPSENPPSPKRCRITIR